MAIKAEWIKVGGTCCCWWKEGNLRLIWPLAAVSSAASVRTVLSAESTLLSSSHPGQLIPDQLRHTCKRWTCAGVTVIDAGCVVVCLGINDDPYK